MHFVLADDQKQHNTIMRSRLEMVCANLGIPAEIGLETDSPKDVLDYAGRAPEETVWLLDIELNDEINGIELCRRIRELNHNAYIIYVSAYQQYALECCQSHAFDFLLKPWSDEQLTECVRAVQRDMQQRKRGTELVIELGTRLIRLIQEDILYFSKDKMSVMAHCSNGQIFTWREPLEALMSRLKPGLFFATHKSYIVNVSAIQEARWSENDVILVNGESLPVARRREAELKACLKG